MTASNRARLSWGVALPVVAGALALKAPELAAGLRDPAARPVLICGTASAAASTALATRVLGAPGKPRRLWPFGLYRIGLALRLNGLVSEPANQPLSQ